MQRQAEHAVHEHRQGTSAYAHRQGGVEDAALQGVALRSQGRALALDGLLHARHAAHAPLQQLNLRPPRTRLCRLRQNGPSKCFSVHSQAGHLHYVQTAHKSPAHQSQIKPADLRCAKL